MEIGEINITGRSILDGTFCESMVHNAEVYCDEGYNKTADLVFRAIAVFEPLFEISASLIFLVIGQIQTLTKNIQDVIYSARINYRDFTLPWIGSLNNAQKSISYKDNKTELSTQNKTHQNLNPLLRRLYTSLNNSNKAIIPLEDVSQQDNEVNTDQQTFSYPTTKIIIKDDSGSQQVLVFGTKKSEKNVEQQSDTSIFASDSPEIPASAASTFNDFTTLSSINWGSQDFKEILAYYNATLIDTSQSNVHKLYVPSINNGIRLLSGNLLPDRSYTLSHGQDLEFELNQRFLPIIEETLKEIEVEFASENIAFAPYIIRYDGIRYDQEMLVITENTNLMQFQVAGLKCKVDNTIASLVNGFEIVYLYNDEFFCLGTLLNADESTDSIEKIVIRLR
jgi:hypothetical protein